MALIRRNYMLLPLALLCGAIALGVAGCSMFQSYPAQVRHAQNALADGKYAAAAEEIEKLASSSSSGDRLCYLFEAGAARHISGQYEASTKHFLKAAEIVKEFDKRAVVSLRNSASFLATLAINDKAQPYRGSPYERILLHTYLAMNFLLQENIESSRVEIRQAYATQKEARKEHDERIKSTMNEARGKKLDADAITTKVHRAYEDQRDLLKKAGNIYQNAFTYYLSCLVYELNGDISDAYIDAKTVHALNPSFTPVQRDLLRYSRTLNFHDDYAKWRGEFGDNLSDKIPEGHGEVVLLYECGLAPVKEEVRLTIPIPLKDHWNVITIAVPKFRGRRNPAQAAQLHAGDIDLGATQALMDVEATAVSDLWERAPGIAVRQILRATGRLAVTEFAHHKGGDLAFLPAFFAGYFIEQADLRSWLSLPRDFQVLRESLPAGTYEMRMDLLGTAGRVVLCGVPVRAGGITVINLRSMMDNGTASFVVFPTR